MVELFPDLDVNFKQRAVVAVDLALRQKNMLEAAKAIQKFSEACTSEEERDFINFCFHLKMEEGATE